MLVGLFFVSVHIWLLLGVTKRVFLGDSIFFLARSGTFLHPPSGSKIFKSLCARTVFRPNLQLTCKLHKFATIYPHICQKQLSQLTSIIILVISPGVKLICIGVQVAVANWIHPLNVN